MSNITAMESDGEDFEVSGGSVTIISHALAH